MSMNSLPIYGIDRELAAKQKAKYDPGQEQEARLWIEQVTGDQLPANEDFIDTLRSGVVLVKLLNKILPPDQAVKFNDSKLPFKQMENINRFLDGAQRIIQCPANDLFQTVDLYEQKNPTQVLTALFSFARYAASYREKHGLPALAATLGPKLADKRSVNFSNEQMNAGKFIPTQQSVSLCYSNK
jgi:hypothetical protein